MRRAMAVAVVLLGGAIAAATPAGGPASADPKRAEIRRKLEARLASLSEGLEGAAGYLILDPDGGETFERNADAVFPAASTIKLPILLELLKRDEEGTLDLGKTVAIDPKARVEGGGVLEKWGAPYPALSAGHLAVLMMDFSDNYATNVLIDLVGMDRVQRRLRGWGLKDTLLRRRMMDLEAARAGRENVTTPREMAALLARLHRGEILDAGRARKAIEIMKRNEGTPLKRGLTPGAEAADKDGELDGVRCGSGLVYVPAGPAGRTGPSGDRTPVPSRPFAISVMTAYLRNDAAGEAFITEVTRAACEYFGSLAGSSDYGRRIE